jgi:hypothetical protein
VHVDGPDHVGPFRGGVPETLHAFISSWLPSSVTLYLGLRRVISSFMECLSRQAHQP